MCGDNFIEKKRTDQIQSDRARGLDRVEPVGQNRMLQLIDVTETPGRLQEAVPVAVQRPFQDAQPTVAAFLAVHPPTGQLHQRLERETPAHRIAITQLQ